MSSPPALHAQGAGFYIVSYATLAAAAWASLSLAGEDGAALWRGLQALGASAGAAAVLVLPGLALSLGRGSAGELAR